MPLKRKAEHARSESGKRYKVLQSDKDAISEPISLQRPRRVSISSDASPSVPVKRDFKRSYLREVSSEDTLNPPSGTNSQWAGLIEKKKRSRSTSKSRRKNKSRGQPRSQKEVREYFNSRLKADNRVYKKIQSAYLRKAVKGEKITTVVNGKKESFRRVNRNDSWVACGKLAGEQYVVDAENFAESYYKNSASSLEAANPLLHRRGFREYQPKRKVLAHLVTEEDMDWFRNGKEMAEGEKVRFEAPWAEKMLVEEGDYLVMLYPRGNEEIYRIEKEIFQASYEILNGPRTQIEVQARFVDRIKGHNQVYRQTQTAYLRRGKPGEQIDTRLDGTHESRSILDDSYWVAYGSAGELSVLTAQQYAESYDESSAQSLEETNPHLHDQGFSEYRLKETVWAYSVTAADMTWFQNGNRAMLEERVSFIAPGGNEVLVEKGDSLAMRCREGDKSVHCIEKSVFESTYEFVSADRKEESPTAPSRKSLFLQIVEWKVRTLCWIAHHITLICLMLTFVSVGVPDDYITLNFTLLVAISGVWHILTSLREGLFSLRSFFDSNCKQEEGSHFTCPDAIRAKLTGFLELARKHTDDLHLGPNKVLAGLVTLSRLLARMYARHPGWRDRILEKEGEPVTSVEELESLLFYLELSDLAYHYLPSELELALKKLTPSKSGDSGYRLFRLHVEVKFGRVGHFVAIHDGRKEVIISIQGTTEAPDFLTDLALNAVPHCLPDGTAVCFHEGMYVATKRMVHDLESVLSRTPKDYSIVVCGHSLGGGVACLLGTLLKAEGRSVVVKAFAVPPCMSLETATSSETKAFMTCIVNNGDIVPRISLVTIRNLLQLLCVVTQRLGDNWIILRGIFRLLTNFNGELLMSPEELEEAREKCREDDFREECLFVPGRVIKIWERSSDIDQTSGAMVDSREGDGTMNTLREIQLSSTMLNDHKTTSYKRNLKRLIARAKQFET